MTAVVDASAIVAILIDSGRVGIWAETVVGDTLLAGPELAPAETSNILRRLERAGEISRLEATRAYRDLLQLDLTLFPFAPFADRIWELRSNLTSYDAWYVAVAEALRCPLVTLDAKLGRAPGPKCEIIGPPQPRAEEHA